MKNLIWGFTEKSDFWGAYKKSICWKELPKKGELGKFAGLRGGLLKKRGGGGDIPMCTMIEFKKIKFSFF